MSDELRPGKTRRGARRWLDRARQVAGVFARYGFAPAMQHAGLGRFIPHKQAVETEELDLPARLRLALQELGPVAVKLGQVLASRPDLLPKDFIAELRGLQDAVATFPFEDARRVVESELGRPLGELFAEFSPEPAAAASLAQVHKARLRTGEVVAVKVQRPDAEAVVDTDLQILLFAARVGERYSRVLQSAGAVEVAQEFAYYMRNELDFRVEGHNTDRLREALSRLDFAKVPDVHWPFTGRRVLTMEWCQGIRANDRAELEAAGIDLKRAAAHIATVFVHGVFGAGFFHGDPHGGNILIQPGEGIVLLDCGNAHAISRRLRDAMAAITAALLAQDSEALTYELLDLGVVTEQTNVDALFQDVDRMLARYASIRSSEVRVGEAMDQVLSLVLRHHVRVPAAVGAIGRALIVTEGLCRQLDPDFDFRQVAQETLPELGGGIVGLTARRLRSQARQLGRFAALLPKQASRFLTRANSGSLRVRMALEDAEHHLRRLDVMANRLAFALVVAAFVMSSAIIVSSERAMASITPLGGALYAGVAAIFGLWLLYSIIRSGRL
ncbi:MAG: AarF/ABC1/UbiB kinase family protein [Armatimonadetes bacterium]|nr:AarF/ABC1/UbiB kinase family protein [Armatimonadota bacterium]